MDTKILYKSTFRKLARLSIAALLLQLLAPFLMGSAFAGHLTYTMVRTDRMIASTVTTGTICAMPMTITSLAQVMVTFPTGFTVGAYTTWTVSTATTTSWPPSPVNNSTTATAWPGITAPTSGQVSGQNVTFASGSLTASVWYCFNWAGTGLTTGTAGSNYVGTVTTQTSVPATLDTGTFDLDTVANDQIATTATVNPLFTLAITSTSVALGTLSTGGPTAGAADNLTVNTNANSGWDLWAADPAGTPGLTSTIASKTIAYSPSVGSAAAALSTGVEGYNVGLGTTSQTSGSGTITKNGNFDAGGTNYKGGGLDGTMRILAYSTGTANTAVVPLIVNASISAITPAATDYAGTITVVGAGRF